MERYEQYKDSGVEWIGEIPYKWKMASLKWKSKIFSGGTPDKNRPEYWFNGSIPWLNSGAVNQFIIKEPSSFITEEGFKNSSAKWIEKDSLVMALAGQGKTKGMSALVTFRTTCNQSLSVIHPKPSIISKFLLYYLQSNYLNIRALAGEGIRDGLNLEMVGSISIPLLPENEQIAIANYLDHKTAEIDALISQKEHLLALYEEEKSAIINHAVTKGIDPDAPLEDSGVEWLGKTPKEWDIVALKRLTSKITDGEHISPEFTNSGMHFLSAKDVRDGFINLPDDKFVDYEDGVRFRKRCNPELNDILLVSRGATVGRVSIVDVKVEFCLLGSVILLKPNERVRFKYLFYSLKNKLVQDHFLNSSQSSAQQAIYLVGIATTQFAIPKLEVQEAIVDHIETEIARIDAKISKTKQIIELQKEYRTALISEVVTGKVKVPNLVGEGVAQ